MTRAEKTKCWLPMPKFEPNQNVHFFRLVQSQGRKRNNPKENEKQIGTVKAGSKESEEQEVKQQNALLKKRKSRIL